MFNGHQQAQALRTKCTETLALSRLEKWDQGRLAEAQCINIARALGADNPRGVARVANVAEKQGALATLRAAYELLCDPGAVSSSQRMKWLESRAEAHKKYNRATPKLGKI